LTAFSAHNLCRWYASIA